MLAVTLTVSVALFISPLLSVTINVKAEVVAVQEATISAVTCPAELTARLLIVIPVPVSGAASTDRVLSD